jgi:hypothetical protein
MEIHCAEWRICRLGFIEETSVNMFLAKSHRIHGCVRMTVKSKDTDLSMQAFDRQLPGGFFYLFSGHGRT